jgi:acyl-CoA-binding protein
MYSTINPNSTADQNPATKLVLYYRFDQGTVGANNASELGLYNSAIIN